MSPFIHRWEPGETGRTVLALHGTGGDENDLVELAQTFFPGDSVLSPRGQVSEHGMARFFRRYAEGVFDLEDVEARTQELGELVGNAATEYGFTLPISAMGYSNGANIACTLLLRRPELLDRAVLLRAMVVLPDPPQLSLEGKRVLLLSGRTDPILPLDNARELAAMLRDRGAEVDHVVLETGHGLTRDDVRLATEWATPT